MPKAFSVGEYVQILTGPAIPSADKHRSSIFDGWVQFVDAQGIRINLERHGKKDTSLDLWLPWTNIRNVTVDPSRARVDEGAP